MSTEAGPLSLESDEAEGSWRLPFLGRAKELEAFHRFLQFDADDYDTSRLVVSGDSGTGKSYLAKLAVKQEIGRSGCDVLCLYVDLSNDEFQSARLMYALLKMSLAPCTPSTDFPLSVPERLTLKAFQEKVVARRRVGWNVLSSVSQAAASFLGLGGAVGAALDAFSKEGGDIDDVISQYLGWVAKRAPVVLMVDNYQFMNAEIRFTLEAIVRYLPKALRFVVIDRTIAGLSELSPPLQPLGPSDVALSVGRFNQAQTRRLVSSVVSADDDAIDTLAADIFAKTAGLAKDIEFCLREYKLQNDAQPGQFDVLGLVSTIDRLPLMHRQFLLIASLLDGGVKPSVARQAVRRLGSAIDDVALEKCLQDLIALQYLKVNSESGDRLRVGHERVIQTMRDLSTDELFNEVRCSLIEEFIVALNDPEVRDNEAYLLHCLVGLQSAKELAGNLHFISRLIRTQHRQEQFAYLVSLADEIAPIMDLLAHETVSLLLDSIQKSSAFERGLQLLSALDSAQAQGGAERDLYRYKFLVQLYQYDKAAEVAERLGDGEWAVLYKVNALLAVERNDEAKAATDQAIKSPHTSEAVAVLLRNTVLLYPAEIALQHLERARARFDQFNSPFRTATIDTNAGLIHMCAGNFGEAGRLFERAEAKMAKLGSREIFQALFNQAICHGLSERYDLAELIFTRATSRVPSALLLDQVKISLAQTVFALASEAIARQEALERIERDAERIQGVELPYLRRTLDHNLAVLRSEKSEEQLIEPERLANRNRASLYMPVEIDEGLVLVVNPSIHWRY